MAKIIIEIEDTDDGEAVCIEGITGLPQPGDTPTPAQIFGACLAKAFEAVFEDGEFIAVGKHADGETIQEIFEKTKAMLGTMAERKARKPSAFNNLVNQFGGCN